MYLKITNAEEKHHGLQYQDGLNIDPVPFAKEGSCCRGGIYFTTPEYIIDFLHMGIYIREVTIPEDAEMVMDPKGDKWRASKVILGPRRDLRETESWKWMVSVGVDINLCFAQASSYGLLEIVKFLIESGADIDFCDYRALGLAAEHGKLEVVKYLIDKGSDIHGGDDYAVRWASTYGRLDVVKCLVESGADIHARDDFALRFASERGYLEVVRYLESRS